MDLRIYQLIYILLVRLHDLLKNFYSNQHYFKSHDEMSKLFADLPEALKNNYNLPYRCSFRPEESDPVLPNISSNKGGDADQILLNDLE